MSELNQDYNEIISTTADNDDLQNYISTMYGFYKDYVQYRLSWLYTD